MKYTSRITKTRNNASILGQIGRINDTLEAFGDCGTGLTKITVVPNGRGGFNAEWSDGNGEGEVTVKGGELKRTLTSIARKLGSCYGEMGAALDSIPDDTQIVAAESAFNRHCNEMLVLFNKKEPEDMQDDIPAENPIPSDGFTQALGSVISGLGMEPLEIAAGTDTAEPAEPRGEDELDGRGWDTDNAEIDLKGDEDGSLEVGEGQVGFEKVGDTLRIVFKDISVTLERKAVIALRDFVEDMDIDDDDDDKFHGMMDNSDDDDSKDDEEDEEDEEDED